MPQLPAFLTELYAAVVGGVVRAENGAFVLETPPAARRQARPGQGRRVEAAVARAARRPCRSSTRHDIGEAIQRFKTLARVRSVARRRRQAGRQRARPRRRLRRHHRAGSARPASRSRRPATRSLAALVVVPTDKAAADRLLTQLRGLHHARRRSGRDQDQRRDVQRRDDHDHRPQRPRADRRARRAPTLPRRRSRSRYAVTDDVVVLGYGTRLREGASLDAQIGRLARRHRPLQRAPSTASTRSTGRSSGSTSRASAASSSRSIPADARPSTSPTSSPTSSRSTTSSRPASRATTSTPGRPSSP